MIAYCDVDGVPRAKRREGLEGYGFECSCRRCVEEGKEEEKVNTLPTLAMAE